MPDEGRVGNENAAAGSRKSGDPRGISGAIRSFSTEFQHNLVYRVTHPHLDSTTAFQANEHWLLYVDISSWHYYLLSILSSRRKDVLAA